MLAPSVLKIIYRRIKMIHSSAVVEAGAQIHETAEIGPFCYILIEKVQF